MLGTLITLVVIYRKIRVIRFHASRNKNVFLFATNSISQLAGYCAFPITSQPSFELYQILTTEAKTRGLVCHRKHCLATEDKIYDTIDTELMIEQRNIYNMTGMLVNISVASCLQDRTEIFRSNLGFTRTVRFQI